MQMSQLGTSCEEQPELAILRRAQCGDEHAFALLVRAYQPQVFNFVLRLVGDRALAEDLTQEVFLRVFQALPTFSFRSKFRTWVFQVAKNRVLDELRARGRRPRHVVELDDAPWLEAIDTPLEQGETVAEIWLAIERLPVGLRMALLLRDIVGLRYTEIADTLEIPLPTVKWRIFKARETVVLALGKAELAGNRGPTVTIDRSAAARRNPA